MCHEDKLLEMSPPMNKRFSLCFYLIALCVVSRWVQATPLIVGVEPIDYRPLYDGAGDHYQGLARDLLDAFAKQAGYRFQYRPIPVNRLYRNLVEGKIDFKFPDSPAWQPDIKRHHVVVYSDPVLSYVDGTMVPPARSGEKISEIKRVGTILGFSPPPYRDSGRLSDITVLNTSSLRSLIEVARYHRVDGIYVNVLVGRYWLHKTGNDGMLVYDPGLPHVRGTYRLSTMRYPEVIKRFNRFLKDRRDLVQQLEKRYHVTPIAR